ncbi:MAG TPA: ATP-binding cassette domain-containing protein [Pseudonocardia sp.]|nr:ATP-binding cassette domain-containing protein [Pseudonocardia sp.]
MTTTPTAIEARGLVRRFGRGDRAVTAVDGVDLDVPAGTVFGLLGPNGAGKTTVVRMLTGLLPLTGGRATVAGVTIDSHGVADSAALRTRIGLAGQYAGVDEALTGRENLRMFGRLGHLTRASRRARADELLERFDLTAAADRPARTYSGGMRRRLDLAAALVGDPRVVFLDEPTTGLDPRSRIALWEVVEDLVATGTTVLLTTQYLEEADRLAATLAVIDRGRVIARGTPGELKASLGGSTLRVRLAERNQAAAAVGALAGAGSGSAHVVEGVVRLPVDDPGAALPDLVRRLDAAGVAIRGVDIHEPTLDDVFLALTGRAVSGSDTGGSETDGGDAGGRNPDGTDGTVRPTDTDPARSAA